MVYCALLLAAALPVLPAAPSPAVAQDAWGVLSEARSAFEQGAWTADFTQTYVPAGFSSGDSETGTVAIALPGSLRWDYQQPYPRTFLIVGTAAYSWNEGESAGRRGEVAERDRRHLDLLRLDLEALREHYAAALEAGALDDGTAVHRVAMTPQTEGDVIEGATLLFGVASGRLVGLEWSDVEGNATTFRFSGHRPVEDSSRFVPPAELDWFEE